MRSRQATQVRVIAGGIVLSLLLPSFALAQKPASPPVSPTQTEVADSSATLGDQLPDSPGAVQARLIQPQALASGSSPADNGKLSDTEPTATQQSDTTNATVTNTPQSSTSAQQQQQSSHEPVGTAAAESVQTTGVAASRPAGAALAPAKQRRARSILIKVGAIVGVGAAVATTWALSQSSPSKPPGTH